MVELWIKSKGSTERERENELVDVDLLVVAAVCQRSPKIELSAETSKSRAFLSRRGAKEVQTER